MHVKLSTLVLAGLTLAVLLLSVPGSLREAFDRGGSYLFSHAFLDDLPKRLTGPGRFRFILQPLVATLLGIRSGVADARAGRPPYLLGCATARRPKGSCAGQFATIVNLLTWESSSTCKNAKWMLSCPRWSARRSLGGSGGSGVLMARDEKAGKWNGPAFYTLGGASFGFQAAPTRRRWSSWR